MANCFVIQRFDKGRFDELFDEVYKPAIEAAGLAAYRVDRDPTVTVPIESIEAEIKRATACLADITTDNPNVWYELGFAQAVNRPVVLVCADDRGDKFPFDIQHRTIIMYKRHSPRDFSRLSEEITTRLRAALKKKHVVEEISEHEQLAPVAGLQHHELAVLAIVGAAVLSPDHSVPISSVSRDAGRANVTEIGCTLAIRALRKRNLLAVSSESDQNGWEYPVVTITDSGWEWLEKNQKLLQLQRPGALESKDSFDDDIPF